MGLAGVLVREPERAIARAWQRARSRRLSVAAACFLACLAVYLVAAWWVSSHGLTYALDGGDAVSRVEAANRVLFSRDPHLAAIGFVWGPLLEVLLLPLVALKPIWPALVTQSLAGDITSAAFTAAACWQLFRLVRELGVGLRLALLLTAALALDPLVALHAVDGMSEGWFLFFLISVVRELNRWLRSGSSTALAACGMYLGVSYLARYETAAAACGVVAVVVVATVARSKSPFRERLREASLGTAVVLTPFVVAFLGWAAASWVITGTPFQQFASVYGNSKSLAARGITAPSTAGQLLVNVDQQLHSMIGLEPLLPLIAIAFICVVVRRRDWSALAGPVVLGAVFTFMTYAIVTREIIPLLRYLIVEIPLTLILLATVLAPSRDRATLAAAVPAESGGPGHRRRRARLRRGKVWSRVGRGALVTGAVAAVALSMGFGLETVENPVSDRQVAPVVQALVNGTALPASAHPLVVDQEVVAYLDARHLPPGSVLMDDFIGYPIEMLSANPRQFVITSDSDFQQVLADPATFHVRYVLIPPPRGLGLLDAVNRDYPGAYATGKGIGKLVKTFTDPSGYATDWRLYRVTASG